MNFVVEVLESEVERAERTGRLLPFGIRCLPRAKLERGRGSLWVQTPSSRAVQPQGAKSYDLPGTVFDCVLAEEVNVRGVGKVIFQGPWFLAL